MAEQQGTPAARVRRDPRAKANEAGEGKPAGELSAGAKAALAAASRDREAAPGRLGTKDKVDAVAALLEGGAGSGSGEEREPRRHRREREEQAPVGDDEDDDADSGEASRRGADDEDEGEQGDEGEQHADDATPTLDDLAEHAGVSAADLNKLPVKLGGGQTLTLGEMKARWSELVKLDSVRAEFEERKQQQELDAIDAHRRIRAIVDAFPAGAVPPRVMERLEAQHTEKMALEASLLHKARPEWRDPKYAAAQREGMLQLGKKYGFLPAELASIADHRQVLLLQDYARELAKKDAAKAAARRVEPGTDKRPGAESQRAATDQSGRRGISRKQDISARVARLIQG